MVAITYKAPPADCYHIPKTVEQIEALRRAYRGLMHQDYVDANTGLPTQQSWMGRLHGAAWDFAKMPDSTSDEQAAKAKKLEDIVLILADASGDRQVFLDLFVSSGGEPSDAILCVVESLSHLVHNGDAKAAAPYAMHHQGFMSY